MSVFEPQGGAESSDPVEEILDGVETAEIDAPVEEGPMPKSAPVDRATKGPFDVSEVSGVRPYVYLGGVKIVPRTDLHLRLEVEEASKRVVAVGLEYHGSTLQVQPFAAPRSAGLWHEIRGHNLEHRASQGARAKPATGPFGP